MVINSIKTELFEGSIVLRNRPVCLIAVVTFMVFFATFEMVFAILFILFINKHLKSLIKDCPYSVLTSACYFLIINCQDAFHQLRKSYLRQVMTN